MEQLTAWIINPFDNLPLEGNRPQRYWLMARAFAAAGWDVVYWTSDFNHGKKRRRECGADLGIGGLGEKGSGCRVEEGIQVVLIPTLPYRKNVCMARVRSHLRLARDFKCLARRFLAASTPVSANPDSALPAKPAVIIASTPPLGLCSAAMEVARGCGAKFVCDIQDAWPETFWRLLPHGLKWMGTLLFGGMRRTARRIYREADWVTGVCRRYEELSGRKDFYLAYHGIEKGGGRESGRGESRRRERLVYVGNLGAGYDLATVVRAVERREGLTLDIAGAGPREAELRAMVAKAGLSERVRFHGYVGADELRNLMASCDVGIIPMRDDSWVGLPYKLGDYLAAGLCVVSSLHGECGDLLERTGYGATYDGGSPDSLLAALDRVTPVEVSLPEELKAEDIYPKYVRSLHLYESGGDSLGGNPG